MYKRVHKKDADKTHTLKSMGFYHGMAWRRLRVKALERDHYLCQACLRQHILCPATEVHHLRPVEQYPELSLVLSNLESLCWPCHELTKSREHESKIPEGVRVIRVADGSENE